MEIKIEDYTFAFLNFFKPRSMKPLSKPILSYEERKLLIKNARISDAYGNFRKSY